MLIPKINPIRDKKWRDYLKTLPCRRCGQMGSDPAHLDNLGRGIKAGDDHCVPLCRLCHTDLDTCPNGKDWWWLHEIAIPEAERAYREWK